MSRTFDFIVVGGGSAGAVIAARLSEDPACRVALLEAGERPPEVELIPVLCGSMQLNPATDWMYTADPGKGAWASRDDGFPCRGAKCLEALPGSITWLTCEGIRATSIPGRRMAPPDGATRMCCPISAIITRFAATVPANPFGENIGGRTSFRLRQFRNVSMVTTTTSSGRNTERPLLLIFSVELQEARRPRLNRRTRTSGLSSCGTS